MLARKLEIKLQSGGIHATWQQDTLIGPQPL